MLIKEFMEKYMNTSDSITLMKPKDDSDDPDYEVVVLDSTSEKTRSEWEELYSTQIKNFVIDAVRSEIHIIFYAEYDKK